MNWEVLAGLGKEKSLDAVDLEERRSRSDQFLATLGIFVCGAIVGATLALLLAPKTGDGLRQMLADKLTDLTARAVEVPAPAAPGGSSHAAAAPLSVAPSSGADTNA